MAGSKGGRGGRGGSGYTLATSVSAVSGNTINLPIPLKYGDADPTISPAMRTAAEAWESKRVKNKIEYGMLYKADGSTIGNERRGGSSGVSFNTFQYRQAEMWTHIHPRSGGEADLLGGTFSYADLSDFGAKSPPTARAVASEGTYSISRTSGFDEKGFHSWWKNDAQKPLADHKTRATKLFTDAMSA